MIVIIFPKISEDFQFDLLTNADDVKKITVEDKLNALEVIFPRVRVEGQMTTLNLRYIKRFMGRLTDRPCG